MDDGLVMEGRVCIQEEKLRKAQNENIVNVQNQLIKFNELKMSL